MKWLKQYSLMVNDMRDAYGDGALFFTILPYGFLAVLYLIFFAYLA